MVNKFNYHDFRLFEIETPHTEKKKDIFSLKHLKRF